MDNPEFRDLLSALDNHYPVPGSGGIQKELDQIMIELNAKYLCAYKVPIPLSICCDIWSKKGLTSSCLGISADFSLKATTADMQLL